MLGRSDKKGKGKSKGMKSESSRDEKDKDEDKKGKGKGCQNDHALSWILSCLQGLEACEEELLVE